MNRSKRNVSSSSTLQSEEQAYWTDDLPVCQLSAVGSATNQIYRRDGHRREGHEYEDRCCHFSIDNDIFLYGVFDGHEGSKCSSFASQRMPAELLLGQLENKTTDEEVIEVLQQAFVSVEKGWVESIDDALAKKASLLLQIPDGVTEIDAQEQYGEVLASLEAVEQDIRGGTTAVVALIINNTLYVANIGCSRALLCTSDENNILHVSQLTVDHDFTNEEEMSRLARLCINIEQLTAVGKIGTQHYTRTLGDYGTKSGYKELAIIRTASSDPLLSQPEIHGGIPLDSSSCFLLLFSDGLYEALQSATDTEHANRDIAAMVATEFAMQATLNGVAQAVVDKVVRIHHDTYIASTDHHKERCQHRDDISLLVRNFNYPLPNAVSSPQGSRPSLGGGMQPLSLVIPTSPTHQSPPQLMQMPQQVPQPMFYLSTGNGSLQQTGGSTLTSHGASYTSHGSSNESNYSSGDIFGFQAKPQPALPLDADGRIKPYVDYMALCNALNALSDEERTAFDLKPGYESIPEEPEPKDKDVKEEEDKTLSNPGGEGLAASSGLEGDGLFGQTLDEVDGPLEEHINNLVITEEDGFEVIRDVILDEANV